MAKVSEKVNLIDREQIGLAGEYSVAAELCRRGFYAQLTLGTHKKTDLLVESKKSLMRFSVKSKTKREWPKVGGIWQSGDHFVFVDFKNKEPGELPDFYILNVSQWRSVLKRIQKRYRDKGETCSIDSTNTLVFPPWKGHPKGWTGCVVRPEDISAFKDKWPKP